MPAPSTGNGTKAMRSQMPLKYLLKMVPICAPIAAPVCITNLIELISKQMEDEKVVADY
jgi:hypothetical protein